MRIKLDLVYNNPILSEISNVMFTHWYKTLSTHATVLSTHTTVQYKLKFRAKLIWDARSHAYRVLKLLRVFNTVQVEVDLDDYYIWTLL